MQDRLDSGVVGCDYGGFGGEGEGEGGGAGG